MYIFKMRFFCGFQQDVFCILYEKSVGILESCIMVLLLMRLLFFFSSEALCVGYFYCQVETLTFQV